MEKKEPICSLKVYMGERELLVMQARELLLRYVMHDDERAKEELLALDAKLARRASLTAIG